MSSFHSALKKMQPKVKTFRSTARDIPNLVDVHLWANPGRPGWIEMYANDKGRDCVNACFPKGHIEWKSAPKTEGGWLPNDWRTFEINLPDAAEMGPNNLAPITGGKPLRECSQDALAWLLACSVKHQGGRASMHGASGELIICSPALS